MHVWQLQLLVRKKACEGRLSDLRERHGNVVLLRNRNPCMGPSWHKKDDKLAWIHHLIRRELEEIRHIKMMLRVGPIVGNRVVLWVTENGRKREKPGPNICDIIQREAEALRNRERRPDGVTYLADAAYGLELALEIMNNPYRFLDDAERRAYTEAENEQDRIIENRSGVPVTSQKIQPAGKPGPSLAQVRAANRDTNVVVRRRHG